MNSKCIDFRLTAHALTFVFVRQHLQVTKLYPPVLFQVSISITWAGRCTQNV